MWRVCILSVKKCESECSTFFSQRDYYKEKCGDACRDADFTDKEMYFYLAAFAAAAVIVSCVRRLSVDHARTIAIVLGIAVQLGVICSGEIYLGETGRIVRVILGCMVSLVIALVLDFMILSVDYSRVEHTQFEDDEYYYYVRAVPKAFVSVEDKQVKHINAKRTKKRKSAHGKK